MFRHKAVLAITCTIIGMLLLGWLLNRQFSTTGMTPAWINLHIKHQGLRGVIYFIIVISFATACGFPRQLAALLGGYAFGASLGVLLATLTTTAGCILSFYFSRLLARRFISDKYATKIINIDQFLGHKTFTKTIIIRLLPLGSNLITNLVAGASHVKARYFIGGSCLGYVPQMIIFSLIGSGVEVLSEWKIGLSIMLFIISALLSARLYQQYKREQQTQSVLNIS